MNQMHIIMINYTASQMQHSEYVDYEIRNNRRK